MNKILIVGGGTSGFVSALILKKRFPKLIVDIVKSDNIGIIGVGEGTTEHWLEFINFCGIDYKELINTILDSNIAITELKYEQMHVVENVWNMTESTITLLHLLYGNLENENVLPFGDKQFKRGMQMFYELENTDKETLKKKTNTWKNKKVGLMFIIQYAHYSEFV